MDLSKDQKKKIQSLLQKHIGFYSEMTFDYKNYCFVFNVEEIYIYKTISKYGFQSVVILDYNGNIKLDPIYNYSFWDKIRLGKKLKELRKILRSNSVNFIKEL